MRLLAQCEQTRHRLTKASQQTAEATQASLMALPGAPGRSTLARGEHDTCGSSRSASHETRPQASRQTAKANQSGAQTTRQTHQTSQSGAQTNRRTHETNQQACQTNRQTNERNQ
jgi:small-conductance mechanosensitive channel